MSPPTKSTSALPLHQGLVLELLQRLRREQPEAAELFDHGSMILARADEAAKLPRGHRDRALAFADLIEIQRILLERFSA